MSDPLRSLVECGTKLYLDSVDPQELDQNLEYGAVGATSNPAIVSKIVSKGGLDETIEKLVAEGLDDHAIAWQLTDRLVKDAQRKLDSVHRETEGNAGWVSFELDPLLEDPDRDLPAEKITEQYIDLGRRWAEGHTNRMIKVPATGPGLAALEELAASGVTLNVTLMFTEDQYLQARDAVWRGAKRAGNLDTFKSVYSIFISRIDVYTEKHVPDLSDEAQGMLGILNAKRIWKKNQEFWADKGLKLEQEMIFASTGTKNPDDPPWKYVDALAGSDIQTNPPETNQSIAESDRTFTRKVDQMPPESVQKELDEKIDIGKMHQKLMEEGIDKFAKPQYALLKLISEKREALTTT